MSTRSDRDAVMAGREPGAPAGGDPGARAGGGASDPVAHGEAWGERTLSGPLAQPARGRWTGGDAQAGEDERGSGVRVSGLAKCFGPHEVLREVDLEVSEGSITAILGPSGSGKTTLLRIVAGFDRADAGTVAVGGQVVDDGRKFVRPQRRGVGYVPQEGALFPHLNVAANVAFGVARAERKGTARLIELVGLAGMERRFPHQLSGGQQQRVALARALAIRPQVVLLDEPFSSLDASLREGVRRDVAHILADTGTTAVLVTHDQDEALSFADQIAVLREGRVVAVGGPRALYQDPPDLMAATSIGDANLVPAEVRGDEARCVLGVVRLAPDGRPRVDGEATVLLRPEQLVLVREQHGGRTHGRVGGTAAGVVPVAEGVPAVVVEVQYHGHDAIARLRLGPTGGEMVSARVAGDLVVAAGDEVRVTVAGYGRAWAGSVGGRAAGSSGATAGTTPDAAAGTAQDP